MKIRESKNLKYDNLPWMGPSDQGIEKFRPEDCVLESFNRIDEKINLFFRNGSQAIIKAANLDGGREVDLVEKRLSYLLRKHYNEILDTDI